MADAPLHLVTVVVQRKAGKKVLDAAIAAGATGATFFYGQGTGVRQKLGFLGAFIDAEKQVIQVVAAPALAREVLAAVVKAGDLEKPGSGFAFVQEVIEAVGFLNPPASDAG
ncbi:MAG: P-II family nitrogen regulator [Alphaproteobacteria bacterium]|nr:P-II family nitrogen regulator [Alphaproteobacteria bacterium]